ncbi:MAG: phosphodiester glycosidase family protein [Candidatus Saganbacteria bacterium]|nr:phosphodiester glycosidase family protein [Candidatus Saganbacteria bacterium]
MHASPSTLERIRFANYPDKIRIVFDFKEAFAYQTQEADNKIAIKFISAEAGPDIASYTEINDIVLPYIETQKQGNDLIATIPFLEPVKHSIFKLDGPPRLVVDFGREYLNIVSGGTVAEGVEYLKVKKGIGSAAISANVLKIDLNKRKIKPALAKKHKPGLFLPFIDRINPWKKNKSPQHFFLDKVSYIAKEHNALAAVNGTYFASNATPLGALMIDYELVSSPIHNRTAFFLDEKKQPYIDNISIVSYFELEDKTRYDITGINQNRTANDIIMYTPVWGESTETNKMGIELVIKKGEVSQINVSDSEIPSDGYVLSLSGPAVLFLAPNIKKGNKIKTTIKVIPYAASPKSIVQLVSGGPRLLKGGRIYVSKHEEKFKKDIARGRAARTAIGITKQGDILLVTIDGPKKAKKGGLASSGATLEELSNIFLSLGAISAMNLDGGSSSTMVIKDKVVNAPNRGYQRRVSNAILVY